MTTERRRNRLRHPKNERKALNDTLLSDIDTAIIYLSAAFTTPESIFNSPNIIDEIAFHKFYKISVSAIENRLDKLGIARVQDLIDMAKCKAKGVEYISRDQYRNCISLEELQNLMGGRAFSLLLSGFFLEPATRKPKEVSRIFTENYGISPPEINTIIKENGWITSATKLELTTAHEAKADYTIYKNSTYLR